MVLTGVLVPLHWTLTYRLPFAGTLFMNSLLIVMGGLFGILLVVRKPPHASFYVTGLKVCLVFIILHGLADGGLELYYQSVLPTWDVRRYDALRENFWQYDLDAIDHFPPHVPANAERVFFFGLPRVAQRSPIMQLRYATDTETLAALKDSFASQQTSPVIGDPRPILYAGEQTPIPMPPDFTLYYLPKTHNASKPSVTFTQQRGVAISDKRGEIIYWAQETQRQTRRVKHGMPTYDR